MSSAGLYPVYAKAQHVVLAHARLYMTTGAIAVSSDPFELISSVTRNATGNYKVNLNDDWSYISGSASVDTEGDNFGIVGDRVYTKGSCSFDVYVVNAGSVAEANIKYIHIDLILER